MIRKLIVLAITSGLAARLYRGYVNRRTPAVSAVRGAAKQRTQRRRAGVQSDQA